MMQESKALARLIARHRMAWQDTAQHSTAQHSTAQHSAAQRSTAQRSTADGILAKLIAASPPLIS
jgi:hypothetical protein